MRRALLAVLLVLGVGVAWYLAPSVLEDLPSSHRVATMLEREDAKLDTGVDDPVYGREAPFDCRRSDGDGSLDDVLDDVDFICTPRKNDGEACDPGECAGFAVDVRDGKLGDYEQFGA